MKNLKLKFFGGGKFVLALATVVFVLTACKVADAGATADDGTANNPPPVTPTTYTVTIDANTGSLGSFKSKIVNNGDKLPAFVGDQLPSKKDYEIAYWSTSPDTYSDLFEFDKSQITKDTTIYPHWRYTLAKVSTLLIGDWDMTTIKRTYRLRSDSQNTAYCTAMSQDPVTTVTTNYIIKDNSTLLAAYKAIPINPTLSQLFQTVTANGVDTTIACIKSPMISAQKLSYTAPNNDDINAIQFADFFIGSGAESKIILRSNDYYANNYILEIESSQGLKTGTHTATRIP